VSYHLEPLSADDTHAYINHRLKHASVGAPLTFARDVTDVIHQYSRGVARMINVISDAVLLYGYGADKHAIDVDLTREVLGELGLAEPVNGDLPLRAEPPAGGSASSSPSDLPLTTAPAPHVPSARTVASFSQQPASSVPPPSMHAAPAFSAQMAAGPRPRITVSAADPATTPARIVVAPPNHYVLSDPKPRSGFIDWWARVRRAAFGTPRTAPES